MAKPPDSSRPGQSHDNGTTPNAETEKVESLEPFRSDATGHALTTDQGVRIADNQNSLRAGPRGPTLLEDFIMREKITHFDHERIPERIVHARGTAAHGYFQVYESMAELSKAAFLQDPEKITPVYARFSTVGGSRGSADTPRDVRGFAVKFYTDEGNYDLVGNNMPVFFIQDAIKFPDLIHAVKPEPHNEIPQASSAHDTFWDFVSLTPETTHTVMWLMSDRALPRSLRTMEGFGVHTFRLVNAQGKGRFVKFHWRPVAGAYSLLWDEAQKLAGKDADFNRRDLWESIENRQYPEFELGVQIVEEADEHKFEFDLLDPTKLIPEELVPVKIIGKMTLNRNPDSFFAETEQVAFHPGHVVPGIDFTNDPLLQGRLFSYTDTQISRLGGPNFHEIPINRAVVPMHNNQRDAMHRQTINVGQASYEPNSIGDGWPKQTPPAAAQGGYESYAEKVDGTKIRVRSESFDDHYSQATMFWNSMAPHEKDHIVSAFQFELGKLTRPFLRERMVANLANVDADLVARVASGLGLQAPKPSVPLKTGVATQGSPALSLANKTKDSIMSRKVAILAAPGADASAIEAIKALLKQKGAHAMVIAPMLGTIGKGKGQDVMADATVAAMPSIVFDAVFVPGGADSIAALSSSGDARHFLLEAYKHLKAIAVIGEGRKLLAAAHLPEGDDEGLVVGDSADGVAAAFFKAMGQHRVWAREAKAASVPA